MTSPLTSTTTGDAGVNGVGLIFNGDLGWHFRAQPVADVGIDAQVEVVLDGLPSGWLLGLQIKAGPSWFGEPAPNGDGWVFRGPRRHRSYWLGYHLPVLVVLYDIPARMAYWELITEETAVVTGAGFKVVVPASQRLDASTASTLADVARRRMPGDVIEHLAGLPASDTLLQGPLRALHLEEDLRQATELRVTDPSSAADRLLVISEKVREAGFPEHATELQADRLEALLEASRLEDAFGEALEALEQFVDRGREARAHPLYRVMLRTRAALTGGAFSEPRPSLADQPTPPAPPEPWPAIHPQIQRSVGLLSYDDARNASGTTLASSVDAVAVLATADSDHFSGAVGALRRVAEAAMLNDDRDTLGRVQELWDQLAPRLDGGAVNEEDDRVRLRLVLADAFGGHDDVVADAISGAISGRLAALVYARHARWLTLNGDPQSAQDQWHAAVNAAVLARQGEDTRDYLWALHQLDGAYGGGRSLQGFEYARRARAVSGTGRALFDRSGAETEALRQLRALERPTGRFRTSHGEVLRVLHQYLLEATVRADLIAELDAHQMLADLYTEIGDPVSRLRHAIRGNDADAAGAAAGEIGGEAAACLDQPPGSPWEMSAALAAYAVIGDLVDPDQASGHLPWILSRLDSPPQTGWTDNEIRDRAMSVLEATAYALPTRDFSAIQTSLTPFLDAQVRQTTMHAAVRTMARLFRAEPEDNTRRAALIQIIRDLPDHAADAILVAGRSVRSLGPDLEQLAEHPAASGNSGAVDLLARLQIPHPAVIERARKLFDEVLAEPTGTRPEVAHFGGPSHEPAGIYGRVLPDDDRARLADKLAEIAEDGATTEYDRAQATYALHHLASTLDTAQRERLFIKIWPMAGGTRPGDLTVSIFKGRFKDAVLLLSGDLATTPDQRAALAATAISRLVDEDDVAGMQPLINSSAENNVDLALLSRHPKGIVRQTAAVLWARRPTDPSIGLALAADHEPKVRLRLAENISRPSAESVHPMDDIRKMLLNDSSATVRLTLRQAGTSEAVV